MSFNCIIMGAAGRDFHDFRTFFRRHREFRVVAFTATQIPFIETRSFPRELAGEGYDADIPIYSEDRLAELIATRDVQFVFFAYSDIAHTDVMHRASIVQAAGASFVLLGPALTEVGCTKPVVALTATRTGAGKSPITQWLAKRFNAAGIRAVTVRHPMPYGNLRQQAVQRFATYDDFETAACTIEEREEYEPYVREGLVVFAGVDYVAIAGAAEAEADVVLWDGGNNDFPFLAADVNIVVCDALRPGHGAAYYPGETNVRRADIAIITKVDAADADAISQERDTIARLNPRAEIIEASLTVSVDDPEDVRGKRAIVIEDGPTVTHGGMGYGAGWVAASRHGAQVIDPRPFAAGTIASTFRDNPHLQLVLPAMGYSAGQVRELEATIDAARPEVVIDGSPADLGRLLRVDVPVVQARYRFEQRSGAPLFDRVRSRIGI